MAASYRGRYTPGTIEVPSGGALKLSGTTVSSTAAELNILDASNTEPAEGAWTSVYRVAKATYDFDADGGAVSTIDLGITIPDNALVTSCVLEKITGFASSGSATVALGLESTTDIIAATAFNNAALTQVVAYGAALASAPFKTTAARNVQITIGTAALTAGKFNFYIEYLVGSSS